MVRPIMGPVPRTAISESATPGKANNIRCAKAPPAGLDIDQACPGPARLKVWRRAGQRSCRIDRGVGLRSLAFPPYVLQGCGCRCHRSHIFAVIAAGWCPGGTAHSMAERLARRAYPARVPPWTTPGVPRVRGTGSRLVRIQALASARGRATAPTAFGWPVRCWMRAERRLTCRCGRPGRWRARGLAASRTAHGR